MTERFIKLPCDLLARPDLTANAKCLLAYLSFRQGGNGSAWPSLLTIARDLGVAARTVARSTAELERAGLLAVERPQGNPRHMPNKYRVITDKMSAIPAGDHGQNVRDSETGSTDKMSAIHGQNVRVITDKMSVELEENQLEPFPHKGARGASCRGAPKTKKPQPHDRQPSNPFSLAAGEPARREPSAHRQLAEAFRREWAEAHNGAAYQFQGGRDAKAAQQVLDAVGGRFDEAVELVKGFLSDGDSFHAKRGHTLNELARDINAVIARRARPGPAGEDPARVRTGFDYERAVRERAAKHKAHLP